MKYGTPELTASTTAINVVQAEINKQYPSSLESTEFNEGIPAYADWED
jgi:hypothetical protein